MAPVVDSIPDFVASAARLDKSAICDFVLWRNSMMEFSASLLPPYNHYVADTLELLYIELFNVIPNFIC